MTVRLHDGRACELGEGAFWHPAQQRLYWCDIIGHRLLCDDGSEWLFDECISAIGWVSETLLFIASETALFTFDTDTSVRMTLCALEADQTHTRSNDGRADPQGGFWIGTMGKQAELDAGAIYRFYKGQLRRLFAPVTIPNAICFSPDGSQAYFTDTYYARVMRVTLDVQGWPIEPPVKVLDLAAENLNPDGATTTARGDLLVAHWGASRVALYGADGTFKAAMALPTSNVTCPALGGPELSTLFVTSARQGLSEEQLRTQPDAGKTFAIDTDLTGLPAPQVIL